MTVYLPTSSCREVGVVNEKGGCGQALRLVGTWISRLVLESTAISLILRTLAAEGHRENEEAKSCGLTCFGCGVLGTILCRDGLQRER